MRQSVSRMCCWVRAFTSAAVIFGAASTSNRASGLENRCLTFLRIFAKIADVDEGLK